MDPKTPAKKPVVTVIVCAYNEEEYIGAAARSLKRWREADPAHRNVVVVNDGSTDRTGAIAREAGIDVIPSDPRRDRNLGKGGAFIRGVNYAHGKKTDVIVTLDADLDYSGYDEIRRNIDYIAGSLWRKMREGANIRMLIARTTELIPVQIFGGDPLRVAYPSTSGQRAISAKSLAFLLDRNSNAARRFRSLAKGYGLEGALNRQFMPMGGSAATGGVKPEYLVPEEYAFDAVRSPDRGPKGGEQGRDLARFHSKIRERNRLAAKIRQTWKTKGRKSAMGQLDRARKGKPHLR